MIEIELAGTPRGKGRPRFSRKQGRAYTPAETVSYERALAHEAALVMRGQPILEGALQVVVTAFMPVPASWSRKKRDAALSCQAWPTGKPDCDNIIKVLDALNQIVWRDDAQIVQAYVHKEYSERPRLRVQVYPLIPALHARSAA